MRRARTIAVGGTLAALAAGIAGCADRGTYVGPPGQPQPMSIEGEWIGADGASVSRFAGGTFTTSMISTGEILANGSYRMTAPQTVSISMHSVVRQTTSTVTCAVASAVQMMCTAQDGRQFSLTRRAAG
ncbi:hypothetical protein [Microbaculum marinum]|uniref:Outer membrane lipoprotein n=1 Tax=Microbaculum marinum TaxID=1764581 RepID=A0AAW9RVG7_9HYPH